VKLYQKETKSVLRVKFSELTLKMKSTVMEQFITELISENLLRGRRITSPLLNYPMAPPIVRNSYLRVWTKDGLQLIQSFKDCLSDASNTLEHWRIFRKILLFNDVRYKVDFKGSYEIMYLYYIFNGIFTSVDCGFEFLSKLCDDFRAHALKEKVDDYLVSNTKNLRFSNQVAVCKRALCKRPGTITIDENLLTYKKFKENKHLIEIIPQTFCQTGIVLNSQFSSTKACLINTQENGGAFSILKSDIKDLPIFQDFCSKQIGDYEVNPTIWSVIKNTPILRLALEEKCFKLVERYHDCNNPLTCENWDMHPSALITVVNFRGGKSRPLTMFLPEINYLGSIMKSTFKEVLKQNRTTNLFLRSKYYYDHIRDSYKPGMWLHSGDFKSCTNKMVTQFSKYVLWEIWIYVTGNKDLKYYKIISVCFSYFRLIEQDPELHAIRHSSNISEKRKLFEKWEQKAPFIKQLNGQHMGMSLSFWIMGAMHALETNLLYKSPKPRITFDDEYNIRLGKGIHPDKVLNMRYTQALIPTERDKHSSEMFSFGDDCLHMSMDVDNINFYRQTICQDWNMEWSNKGDFLTREGCVFTERVLTRQGAELVPLYTIKSKLLFREPGAPPYGLDSIKALSYDSDEYSKAELLKLGFSQHKINDLAKRVMFEAYKDKISNIPLHVHPKYGGLGMPGFWNKKDYKWMIGMYQISKNESFNKQWKNFQKSLAPVLEEPKREYVKVHKVHEGDNFYTKSVIKDKIYNLIGLSESLVNDRPRVKTHRTINDINGSYQRVKNLMKTEFFKKDFRFNFAKLQDNMVDNRLIGIDDDLDLALGFREDRNYNKLTKNFIITDTDKIITIIKNANYNFYSIKEIYDYLIMYFKFDINKIINRLMLQLPEEKPYEFKANNRISFNPIWPVEILCIGIEDDGTIIGTNLTDLTFNYYNILGKRVAIKIVKTRFENLSKKQILVLSLSFRKYKSLDEDFKYNIDYIIGNATSDKTKRIQNSTGFSYEYDFNKYQYWKDIYLYIWRDIEIEIKNLEFLFLVANDIHIICEDNIRYHYIIDSSEKPLFNIKGDLVRANITDIKYWNYIISSPKNIYDVYIKKFRPEFNFLLTPAINKIIYYYYFKLVGECSDENAFHYANNAGDTQSIPAHLRQFPNFKDYVGKTLKDGSFLHKNVLAEYKNEQLQKRIEHARALEYERHQRASRAAAKSAKPSVRGPQNTGRNPNLNRGRNSPRRK